MSAAPLRMIHPGPRSPNRQIAVASELAPIDGILPKGMPVMQAVGDLLIGSGCNSAVLWLGGMSLAPMRYVLPALSTDGLHAAWYSETHAPAGTSRIETATAMVGWRDDAPFLHCHGIWTNQDGSRAMGHLLPFDSGLAEDFHVRGIGCLGAGFVARPDAETAFTLFTPEAFAPAPRAVEDVTAKPAPDTAPQGLLLRLLPGENVVTAIEEVAARHKIRSGRIHGIGSIDHVRFKDGRRMDCLATELRLVNAALKDGRAEIEIDVVDIHGQIASGLLAREGNPVGVTMELLIDGSSQFIPYP